MDVLVVTADDVNVSSREGMNKVEVSMFRPEVELSQYFTCKDIVNGVDNLEDLFEAIIKKDEEILHNYMQEAGIIYNKG